ncbi:hypothetical protein JCM3770_007229 [Rhodotorula araucariae]
MHIHPADIDKAYLHGELDKELYMRIPEGIDDPALAGKVLKLDRALYSLKQAGRVWNHRIHASLAILSYMPIWPYASISVRCAGGVAHYIALYVDDLLFVSPSIKTGLKEEYGIKDLGKAHFILGIQIYRCTNGGVILLQCAYLGDVLLRLGQAGCRTAPTLMFPLSRLRAAPKDHTPSPLFRHSPTPA